MGKRNGWIDWRDLPTGILASIVATILMAAGQYAVAHRDEALSLWHKAQTKVTVALAPSPEAERFAAILEAYPSTRLFNSSGGATSGYARIATSLTQ